ncbi:TMEM165/GDT1 family protein [Sphingomonas pseudosanguinis]|uniref:Putative Ca2+/H+ antiporter (TMEM165/GDT1 family) n=1 Tax=Sphingomonas pseudosanguinis TaxID=413712 RepID=A0A7W6ACK8_9SPHN|nr:TMEM165/GDT1 family protein [Sphingomonas pseudosanguinis]MBB3880280.1 putative Ca2+/H+ antiporter (TMEM165/GDT1 family) [Sphingomonas pseudosanguinis]
MIALVVALLAQGAGRVAALAAQTTDRTGRPGAVMLGVLAAQLIVVGLAVQLGVTIAPSLTPETRTLLLGLAIGLAGAGLLGRLPPRVSPFGSPRLGAFGTAMLGGGAIMLADSPAFVIAMAAARSSLPWAALPGALIGTAGAVLPAILLGERGWRHLPLRLIRIGGGAVMLLTGAIIALSARGLI